MARKQKNSVDYFPHDVTHGKKMHFIESKYKNDGYAVWHKLLEELGKAEYHYLDITDEVTKMYLSSSFNVSEEVLNSIINDLVKMGEFDQKLFEQGILFNQKFIDSISDAYKKRSNDIITRDSLVTLLQSIGVLKPPKSRKKPPKDIPKVSENTQSKLEESKEDNTIPEETLFFPYNSETFLHMWGLLVEEKNWRKKSITSLQASLKKLSKVSEVDAIQMIENCIAGEWQGLHELNNSKNGQIKQTGNRAELEELNRMLKGRNNSQP